MKTPTKAIIVNGYSRGGTNILWNILQSHPSVCSPIYETGELFFDHIFPFNVFDPGRAKELAASPVVRKMGKGYLRRRFSALKYKNLYDENNNTRYEGQIYSPEEVKEAIICFKGVDSDVELNPLLESIYSEVAYVVLVRNGYAVCNGWMRRGRSARDAGRKYRSLYEKMVSSKSTGNKFVLIKFEEMIRDPFQAANFLFQQLELEPTTLSKLRIKSKRILNNLGGSDVSFGSEGDKYWLGPQEMDNAIDANVNLRQIDQLDDASRREFEIGAKEVLERLGYL